MSGELSLNGDVAHEALDVVTSVLWAYRTGVPHGLGVRFEEWPAVVVDLVAAQAILSALLLEVVCADGAAEGRADALEFVERFRVNQPPRGGMAPASEWWRQ